MQALVTAGAFVAIADGRVEAIKREELVHHIALCSKNLTTTPLLSFSTIAQHSGGICQDSLIESTVCGNASAKAENKKQARPSDCSQAADVGLE
jgi:hypothetical protein